jgi:hypothetical protein
MDFNKLNIFGRLNALEAEVEKMSAASDALNAALTQLGTDISAEIAAFQAEVTADLAAAGTPDSVIQSFTAKVQALDATVTAATAAATPAPAPAAPAAPAAPTT